jgi:hypothetical protein
MRLRRQRLLTPNIEDGPVSLPATTLTAGTLDSGCASKLNLTDYGNFDIECLYPNCEYDGTTTGSFTKSTDDYEGTRAKYNHSSQTLTE